MKEDAVNWGAPPLHGTNVSYPWVNFQAGATHGGKKEGIIVPSGRARSPRRPFPAFWPPLFERRGRRSRMPVCQKAEDSVRLFGVFGDFVPFHRSAFQTLVDQLIAFFGMVVDADRFHQTAACVFSGHRAKCPHASNTGNSDNGSGSFRWSAASRKCRKEE